VWIPSLGCLHNSNSHPASDFPANYDRDAAGDDLAANYDHLNYDHLNYDHLNYEAGEAVDLQNQSTFGGTHSHCKHFPTARNLPYATWEVLHRSFQDVNIPCPRELRVLHAGGETAVQETRPEVHSKCLRLAECKGWSWNSVPLPVRIGDRVNAWQSLVGSFAREEAVVVDGVQTHLPDTSKIQREQKENA